MKPGNKRIILIMDACDASVTLSVQKRMGELCNCARLIRCDDPDRSVENLITDGFQGLRHVAQSLEHKQCDIDVARHQ